MQRGIHHFFYYTVLIGVLFLGFWASREIKWLLIALPILYALLGILHHGAEHTLTSKIVIEYTLIASIAIAIFAILLIGGL